MKSLGEIIISNSDLIYLGAVLAELYFFLMQRSLLEKSRRLQKNIVIVRHLLPDWYLLVYPIRLIKYGILVSIVYLLSWKIALLYLVGSLPLISFTPIPHKHFDRLFEKQRQKMLFTDPALAMELKGVLEAQTIA
jgi:hypothetical protein